MAEVGISIITREDGAVEVQQIAGEFRRTGTVAERSARQTSSAWTKTRSVIKRVSVSIVSLAKKMFSLRTIVGTLAGSAGLGYLVKSLVDASAKMESFRTRLIAMTKSEEIAMQKLKLLSYFAAETPFELQEVIEAGITVEAFGAKVKKVIRPIGDLAAYMGTNIVEAASAFGRAFAAGAGAADILRERGVLAMVKLQAGIQDLSKLTLPEFKKALIDTLTDPGGKISGAVELLKDTFLGQMSMMSDAIFRLKVAFGSALMPVIQRLVRERIVPLISKMREWAEANKELIKQKFDRTVNKIVDAFKRVDWGKLLKDLKNIAKALSSIAASVTTTSGVISGIGDIASRAFSLIGHGFSILASNILEVAIEIQRAFAFIPELGAEFEKGAKKLELLKEEVDAYKDSSWKMFISSKKNAEGIRDMGNAFSETTKKIEEQSETIEKTTKARMGITTEQREKLIEFLKSYKELFSGDVISQMNIAEKIAAEQVPLIAKQAMEWKKFFTGLEKEGVVVFENISEAMQTWASLTVQKLTETKSLWDHWGESINKTLESWRNEINNFAGSAVDALGGGLADAFHQMSIGAKNAEKALSDFARNFLIEINRMATRLLVLIALEKVAGLIAGGVSSGAGTSTGMESMGPATTMVGAKGGIFPGHFTPFETMASGGIYSSPTFGLVAEGRHNEAVVPLPDGRSIPVQNIGPVDRDLKGENVQPIIVSITAVDAKSFEDMARRNPGPIIDVINKALRKAGPLLNTMRNYR